uniref:Pept_C1 domain-containing protein n=1 Tax=Mesocestoides corti TaxID=53468 RepID=A0A5K3G1L8_MESCO
MKDVGRSWTEWDECGMLQPTIEQTGRGTCSEEAICWATKQASHTAAAAAWIHLFALQECMATSKPAAAAQLAFVSERSFQARGNTNHPILYREWTVVDRQPPRA